MLDTQEHCIDVDIVKLPPKIKAVLTSWGSIYVRDEPAGQACSSCGSLTGYCCADCMIERREKVFVCEKPECRDKHELLKICQGPVRL
jgi:hypothetical protein